MIDTELHHDANGFRDMAHDLDRLVRATQTAEREVDHLQSENWTGPAATAFRKRMEIFTNEMHRAISHAREFARELRSFANSLEMAEERIHHARAAARRSGLPVTATAILPPPPNMEQDREHSLSQDFNTSRAQVLEARKALEESLADLERTLSSATSHPFPEPSELLPRAGRPSASSLITSEALSTVAIGTAAAALQRYRKFDLAVPRETVPPPSLTPSTASAIVRGLPVVERPSGLLVLQNSDVDPSVEALRRTSSSAFHEAQQPTMVTDPDLGRPPAWARTAGRGLGVIGSGLTLYDSYAKQWETDSLAHPEWTQQQRIRSAGTTMATEGLTTLAAAAGGAKVGAAIGSLVPISVVGTVGGAIIGGLVGSLIGSRVGEAVGSSINSQLRTTP